MPFNKGNEVCVEIIGEGTMTDYSEGLSKKPFVLNYSVCLYKGKRY